MTEHIGYPSIEQLRNVVKMVNDRADFHRLPRPKLAFEGTVKMHGTNASAVITFDGETPTVTAQSRETILTAEKDNAGFAKFVAEHETALIGVGIACLGALSEEAITELGVEERFPEGTKIAIFGEWCGPGIQKGTALNKLPRKMFVIFGAKVVVPNVSDSEEEWTLGAVKRTWLTGEELQDAFDVLTGEFGTADDILGDLGIYLIRNICEPYRIVIDFQQPQESQNHLVELTNAVEAECPVGKRFGVSGIGEGIVWACTGYAEPADEKISLHRLIFKVKGEKHSDTKTKNLAPVDIEKVRSTNELAQKVCTDHRLEKGIEALRFAPNDGDIFDVKNIGPFLKWVGQDVTKEEGDTIEASGLDRKAVISAVSRIAREWFMAKIDASVGL